MGFRFRQSFKILPGLKLNLSKTGLSASIGGAPFTLNLGNRGLMATASIPGTGLSFRQHLSGGQMAGALDGQNSSPPTSPNLNPPQSVFIVEPEPGMPPIRQIRSASTEQMTSASLSELKDLIQTAYEQHEETSREFLKANEENRRASKKYSSWENGFLFKKLFKKSFENRRVIAEIATARAAELEEQLRLAKIATEIDLAPEQAEPFFRMRDDFSALAGCNAIWDVTAERATDKYRERTTAVNSIIRKKVSFNLRGCDFIQWEEQVPHLENANGGDIYLYPGFILYRASKTAFSMIAFRDMVLVYKPYRFIEEDGVPSDSKVVGQEWAKTNKDGSRDKRFAGNYQIPIALYGELILKSATGLDEKFVVSNPEHLERFAASWKSFAASFDNQITVKIEPTENPESAPVESSMETPSQPKIVGTDVHFECQFCKQPIEVNVEAAGQEFRCPGCGGSLVVPQCS